MMVCTVGLMYKLKTKQKRMGDSGDIMVYVCRVVCPKLLASFNSEK